MFKVETMQKVNIFVLNEDVDLVLKSLYDLEIIEFFDIKEEKLSRYDISKKDNAHSELLKIRSVISILEKYFKKNLVKLADSKKNIDIIEKVIELNKELEDLDSKIIHLKDDLKRYKILKALKLTKDEVLDKNRVIGFISVENQDYLNELLKDKIKYKSFKLDDRIYFTFVKKDKNYHPKFSFKEFYLPSKSSRDIEKIKEKLEREEKKRLKKLKELEDIANKYLYELKQIERQKEKDVAINDIKVKFGKTSNITLFRGFITKKDLKKLKRDLDSNLAGKYVMEVRGVDIEKDDVPTKLNNPSSVKSFESLLKMYSLPKYGEIDPTSLMLLTFPLFFGFILGDVGYGLISLLFFTFLKPKFPQFRDFFSVLQISSAISIIFGWIFGEVFGFEFHSHYFGFFPRAQEPQTLLLIAVIFGLIHINIGLFLGFLNELKHSVKRAIYDKASWFLLELAVLFISLGYYSQNLGLKGLGFILLAISLVLIYLGHGFIGIIEVPSFFTNILSYARLMAVGLSSVAIAILINDYTQVLFSKGFIGALFGILLFSIGHIFNIVLGNFEGFLHTLRLHYVEYFTKFYTGGGREFIPFGAKIKEE